MNILITGGTSGLGKAMVEIFAKNIDNHVFFTFCSNKASAEDIESRFSNVSSYQVDYSDDKSVDAFVEQLSGLTIDVLINNAYSGKAQGTHFHKTEIDDFESSFHNNIVPTIKITQACIAGMRKRKFGKIVNILTSYLIDLPPTGFSVYTATKAYLRQLSKTICKEYGRFNITSNCILPDYMKTPFGQVEDFQLEQMKAAHPLKRLLEPAEVADIIYGIVASSQQLNGVEIPINAGQHSL